MEDLGGPVEDPRAEAWCTHQGSTARRTWDGPVEDLWRTWLGARGRLLGFLYLLVTGARPQSLRLPTCLAVRPQEPPSPLPNRLADDWRVGYSIAISPSASAPSGASTSR